MKKILGLAVVLSLAAPAAFGQADGSGGGLMSRGGGMDKISIIHIATGDDSAESKAVAAAVRRELERSRQLDPVFVDDNQGARLVAPVSLTKDAAGQNMTVAIELRSARKLVETAEVTCPIAKPANCGRDIVAAAEKFMRRNRNR